MTTSVWLARGFLGAPVIGTLMLSMTTASSALQSTSGPLSIAATQALAVRQANDLVNRMVQDDRLRVRHVVTDPLVPGRSHERLAQFQHGVRVFGGDVTRQTERGLARSIFGTFHSDIQVDTVPALSASDASAIADRRHGRTSPEVPELMILYDANTLAYRLLYRVQAFSQLGIIVTLIDANTGAIVREYNDLKTQNFQLPCANCAVGTGRGVKGDRKKISVQAAGGTFTAYDTLRPLPIITYDMRGDWDRALDVLIGTASLVDADLASDSDNDWQDGASVDAHVGTGWFYDYLSYRFERAGLDGNNGPIVSLVHPVRRADFLRLPDQIVNLFHLNAFFCGVCGPNGVMVYGEGLPPGLVLESTGQTVDFFSAGLDIVAHELGHGLTEATSQLIYQGESGALNEAFSDILGVGTEFFIAESGRHRPEQPDYFIGEDVLKPGGIRSLADPLSRGDPDHYSLRFEGLLDNGGVHTNSLIASHAFYLAVEGGTNQTSGIQVTGVGGEQRGQVEQVFYRAFAFLLPANATFAMARAATTQSARDLSDGTDGLEETIAAAWSAVGVE